MTDQRTLDLCHDLITRCNAQHGWSLDDSALARYTAAVMPLLTGLPEERWPVVIANYHADHDQVATLQDANHAAYEDAWTHWCAQVIGMLRRSGRGWSQTGAVEFDDLAQIGRVALIVALPTYRYRSRLSTWAFSVVDRAVRDHLRAANARRRSGATAPLDKAAQMGSVVDPGASPEQVARGQLLAEHVAALLRMHPDERLARIFHLWAVEDQTSAGIGEMVNLHESRVRALLKFARERLREDPTIRNWREPEQ